MNATAAVLAAMPGSAAELKEATQTSHSTVSRAVREALAAGSAHIGSWRPSSTAGPHVAVYVQGPGRDAPKPVSKWPAKQLKRRPVIRRDPLAVMYDRHP